MLKTLGIVQACFEQESVRSKVARRLHGKTVLEWVVRRVTDCTRLDGVIVLTNDAPENAMVRESVPLDVPVVVGTQADALGRFVAALERYPAESAVRIRAESPFVDPGLIDRLITTAEAHPDFDYIGYRLQDGRPAILSPVGVYAEWFRSVALRRSARKATSPDDRREVTRYIYSHPEKFKLRLIPAPLQIDRDDVRLTVDVQEDWEHALAILDALGSDEFDWQRIADLLDHQPNLRRRMADLNRASAARCAARGQG
jgi:spore coat polysaccharide biosynthesis protein SpsF